MKENLVTVKICNERFIAEMIQNYLSMYEVFSIISTDPIGLAIFGNYSLKGFRIMVKEEDYKIAKEILEQENF